MVDEVGGLGFGSLEFAVLHIIYAADGHQPFFLVLCALYMTLLFWSMKCVAGIHAIFRHLVL